MTFKALHITFIVSLEGRDDKGKMWKKELSTFLIISLSSSPPFKGFLFKTVYGMMGAENMFTHGYT